MKKVFILMSFILAPIVLLAQVAGDTVSSSDFFSSAIAFVGGIKGASIMAISVAAVQLLTKFFSSGLSDFAGKYKLVIVYFLSVAASVLAVLASGGSILSAVISGSVLAALQVFVHQIYVQFIQKDPAPSAPAPIQQ